MHHTRVTAGLFFFAITCQGQNGPPNPKIVDFNRHVWVFYSGDHQVSGPWGIHFDAQWRRADWGTEWQQYQLRPALNYHWKEKSLLFTTGYVYTRSTPYGDYPFPLPIPEHRFYQQAVHTKKLGSVTMQHRMRLEQRFIQYANDRPDNWTYQNRYRHLVRFEIPLNGNGWYLPTYDEILIGIAPNYGARPFDQNRVFVGVGKAVGSFKVEGGYLNQFIGQRNGRIFEFNNTILLAITSNASLASLFRR